MSWHNATEQLPNQSGQYWCYDTDELEASGHFAPYVTWFDADDMKFYSMYSDLGGRYFVRENYSVTHWAELTFPEEPSKKPTTKKRVKIKIICKKDFCVDGLGHCFTSGREYKKINYSPCDGYCIKNDIGDDDWIFYPGHEFFDEYFKIVGD